MGKENLHDARLDDDQLEEIENFELHDDDRNITDKSFTIINTNARSLCPKIQSLVDCFEELGAAIGTITETWLTDGQSLQDDIQDLNLGSGIGMICRNRAANSRGFSHGGVAMIYQTGSCNFSRVDLLNPAEFEVLVCAGTIPGHSRKMIVVSCYIPPGYDVARGKACLEYIADVVLEMKRKYKEPYLVISGNFNQWDISAALSDYHDVSETPVGPTRGDRSLDKIYTNFGDSIKKAGSLPPLETENATEERTRRSDHRIAFVDELRPMRGLSCPGWPHTSR